MRKAIRKNTHTLRVEDICPRIREALKRRRPHHTAKLVSQDTGADVRTVERWLSLEDPKPPCWKHFTAIISKYGPAIAAEICAPESDWLRHERRRERLDALEAELQALREERAMHVGKRR